LPSTKDLQPVKHIIDACATLESGFAQRGIIALVDDATGYRVTN